jgi:hypothetical protein
MTLDEPGNGLRRGQVANEAEDLPMLVSFRKGLRVEADYKEFLDEAFGEQLLRQERLEANVRRI